MRRNEKGLTSARYVLAKGPEKGKGTDTGTLLRLKAAKTGIAARDATARLELMALLHERKTQDLPLMSGNAHLSLITLIRPARDDVFLSANVLLSPKLPQRLTLTKITVVGWNRHREI